MTSQFISSDTRRTRKRTNDRSDIKIDINLSWAQLADIPRMPNNSIEQIGILLLPPDTMESLFNNVIK